MEIVSRAVVGFKNAWLVKKNNEHFVLVAGEGVKLGETFAFRSDRNGKVTNWKAAFSGKDFEDLIRVLEQ